VVWDERKQAFVDLNASTDARPEWAPDDSATACSICLEDFSFFRRKHHCRHCGQIFCWTCSDYFIELPRNFGYTGPQRTCQACYGTIKDHQLATGANQSKRDVFNEDILTAQNYIRESPEFEFDRALTDIGHRISTEKTFALLDYHLEDSGITKQVISVTDFTQAPSASANSKFFRFMLGKLQHPNLLVPVKVDVLPEPRNKAIVIRAFCTKGSLRDLLYKASPKDPYTKKYSRKPVKLSLSTIALYGRQILEAIKFFQSIGYPFPHLHSSNVLVAQDGKKIFISEYENSLLGLKPRYFLSQTEKVTPEVECFGNILYEMILGKARPTLQDTKPGEPVPLIPPCEVTVYRILENIFEPNSDTEPVTVEGLLQHQLFSSETGYSPPSVELPKLTSKVTRILQEVSASTVALVSSIYNTKQQEVKQAIVDMADDLNLSLSAKNKAQLRKVHTVATIETFKPSGKPRRGSKPAKLKKSTSQQKVTSNPIKQKEKENASTPSAAPVSKAPSQPIPAPPPTPSAPPPPKNVKLPPPSAGRGALLDSIRQNNKGKLKKVEVSEKSSNASGGDDLQAAIMRRMQKM